MFPEVWGGVALLGVGRNTRFRGFRGNNPAVHSCVCLCVCVCIVVGVRASRLLPSKGPFVAAEATEFG